MKRGEIPIRVPSVELLTERFILIDDTLVRTQIAETYQYVMFLIQLEGSYQLPGSAETLVFRDVVVHVAAIVECLLRYSLKELVVDPTSAWVHSRREYKYSDVKILHKIDETREVVGAIRTISKEYLKEDTNLGLLNTLAKKVGLLSSKGFEASEYLRGERNKIHLGKPQLNNFEGYVDHVISMAKIVVDECEAKLSTRKLT